MEGSVKWFSKDKGYGFIRVESEPHDDLFVHFSNLAEPGYRMLEAGERVSFDAVHSEKGFSAENVRLL